ncbi:MAG: ankyrin repeat domain-containing protein [Xenococcaceae cyanobacterium]
MSENYLNWIEELFDAIEEQQDFNKVRKMIENGCDVNIREAEDCTPLIAAVRVGNLEMVKLLVELGADVNVVDGYFECPLYYAKYNGFPDIAEYLEPMTNAKLQAEVERSMSGKFYPPKRKKH